jgi:hypothetical protein
MRKLAFATVAAGVIIMGGAAAAQHVHGDASPAPAPAPTQQLTPQPTAAQRASNAAFRTFASGCAPNLSRPEVMQLVMSSMGLKLANDRIITQIPHETDDFVWVVPQPGMGVVAVWSPDAKRCSVLLQQGDLDELKRDFSALLTDTAKPGLAVDKVKDEKRTGPNGAPIEVIAFEVYATPKQPAGDDRLYTLTLYRGENPRMAAVLEGERLSGKPTPAAQPQAVPSSGAGGPRASNTSSTSTVSPQQG